MIAYLLKLNIHRNLKIVLSVVIGIAMAGPMAAAQAPATPETPESLFKTNCALCHGDDGAGTELGKRFKVKDLRSKEVQDKSSADLALIVHDGKDNMPPFGKRLDDKQIESLIGYIRHLAPASH
jgi:mono/diheme cytochrome c family protein